MTQLSRKQIAEIEGEIYLLNYRTPPERRSEKFSEIIRSLKRMLRDFEHHRKYDLQPVKRCLTLLVASIETGHVSIVDVESKEVWDWAIREAKRLLANDEIW